MYFSCHALELAFPVDPVGVMHLWLAADSWVSAQLVPWCYFSAEKIGVPVSSDPNQHLYWLFCFCGSRSAIVLWPLCKAINTGGYGKLWQRLYRHAVMCWGGREGHLPLECHCERLESVLPDCQMSEHSMWVRLHLHRTEILRGVGHYWLY